MWTAAGNIFLCHQAVVVDGQCSADTSSGGQRHVDVRDRGHVARVEHDGRTRDGRDQRLQNHADEHQHVAVG